MMQNALACFVAQTELANLTGSLPAGVEYAELSELIQQRSQSFPGSVPHVFHQLEQKRVRLPDPDDMEYAVAAMSLPPTIFLFDIEGTITPYQFMTHVVQPIVHHHLWTYMKAHFPSDGALVELLTDISQQQATADAKVVSSNGTAFSKALSRSKARGWGDVAANDTTRRLFCEFFQENVSGSMMDSSFRKIRDNVLADAYSSSLLETKLFPDVNKFFRFAGGPAMASRTRVALYSTSNVVTQKELMSHTSFGDLTPFIMSYFDTALVGTKLAPKSYMKIRSLLAEQMDVSPEEMNVVLVTDNSSEASAAEASGAVESAILCVRPYNPWMPFDTIMAINVPFINTLWQLMKRDYKVNYEELVIEAKQCMRESVTPSC